MNRVTMIVVAVTIIGIPFAIIVMPFYIGWMICDSFIECVSVPLGRWCKKKEGGSV